MGRTGKIAIGAGLGGLMLAIAIGSASRTPAPPRSIALSAPAMIEASPNGAASTRCRTITNPDRGCDALWEARRQHFFGEDERK